MNESTLSAREALGRFFGVVLRGRSYLNIAYLWLAFPLGLAYFVMLVVGVPLGIGLVILWIGLLVLFLVMLGVWAAAGLERQLAIALLGAAVPERRTAVSGETPGRWLRSVFGSAAMWKGLGFLALKFPLGLAGWIFSVVSLTVSGVFLAAPLVWPLGGRYDFCLWRVTSESDTIPLALTGLFMLLVTLHAHNGLAWIWKRLAELMLGGSPAPAAPQASPPSEATLEPAAS